MSWDIDVSEKLYQRLANEIFFRILHGKYRTGDKMPSYTELAKEAGSSPETVRKAFRELQHYGVIEKMRRGYFVTADEAVVMAYRQQYLTKFVGQQQFYFQRIFYPMWSAFAIMWHS